MLLDAWMECEKNASKYTLIGDVSRVEKLNPKKIKMRKAVSGGAGSDSGEILYEEYYDYQFPDDEKVLPGLKLLEKALLWKQLSQQASDASNINNNAVSNNNMKDSNTIDLDDV